MVWFHLIKQIGQFPKERLEELVHFVPEARRSELMPEVLRSAASKFPAFHPLAAQRTPKLTWTVPGCGAPETSGIQGSDGYVNHFYKKLKNVAKLLGINFTIVEVNWSPTEWTSLKIIAKHVKQQGKKLASFEMNKIGAHRPPWGPHPYRPHPISNKTFFSLSMMSMNWKVNVVEVGVDCMFMFKLDHLADSSLENGHIGRLEIYKEKEEVDLTVLKRVWQITDEMLIYNGYPSRGYPIPVQMLKVRGGKGEDPEAVWQTVLNFFLHGNNNE